MPISSQSYLELQGTIGELIRALDNHRSHENIKSLTLNLSPNGKIRAKIVRESFAFIDPYQNDEEIAVPASRKTAY